MNLLIYCSDTGAFAITWLVMLSQFYICIVEKVSGIFLSKIVPFFTSFYYFIINNFSNSTYINKILRICS